MIDDKAGSLNDSRPAVLHMVRNPRVLLAAVLAYAGVGLIMIAVMNINLSMLLQRYGLIFAGTIFIATSFMLFSSERQRTRLGERQFIDVDDQSKGRALSVQAGLDALRSEIQQLRSTDHLDEEKIAEIIRSSIPAMQSVEELTFARYYVDVKNVLQEKASNADAKASLLLDRGVAYSRMGIMFFVVSIIVWQILSWQHGFQVQFIYGIISCSLLFITIEFLSAWFLRQYVQFVDTSTYLMKVKSIFDRYILTYLAALDERVLALTDKTMATGVLAILKDDIKWPDSYLLKSGEVSFAREMMESLASVAKAVQASAKPEKKESAS